jgi:molybdopterin molybdotransferase
MRDVRMRGFRERTAVDDAVALLERRITALATESVAVRDAAGRVAAEEVRARISVPHFARAAMDGWAVVGESTFGATTYAPASLRVVGDARPGRPYSGAIRHGEAVAIATGAPVPDGADAVLMAEHGEPVGDAVRSASPCRPASTSGRSARTSRPATWS